MTNKQLTQPGKFKKIIGFSVFNKQNPKTKEYDGERIIKIVLPTQNWGGTEKKDAIYLNQTDFLELFGHDLSVYKDDELKVFLREYSARFFGSIAKDQILKLDLPGRLNNDKEENF